MFNRKDYDKKYHQKHKEHYKEYCRKHKEHISEYNKKYRQENKEYNSEYKKKYYQENKEHLLELVKQWKKENPEYKKKYRKNNLEKIREYNKKYLKDRRKTDFKFNLNIKVSVAIRSSLKGNKKGRHWENLVGYTLNDLIKRLKRNIPEGYVWNDFIKSKLQIDHIIPISVFNFTKPEHIDFKRCWSLENLRLLPAKENFKKNNLLIKPFQPALKLSIKEGDINF